MKNKISRLMPRLALGLGIAFITGNPFWADSLGGSLGDQMNYTVALPIGAQDRQPRMAVKDQSATGREVLREKGSLIINLSPCGTNADFLSFHKPYVEEDAGETTCVGRTIKLIAVTQK